MFIKNGRLVKVTYCDGTTYTGTVYKTAVQLCVDDDSRPYALVFISQNKCYAEKEGDFGCAALWLDKIKSLELL